MSTSFPNIDINIKKENWKQYLKKARKKEKNGKISEALYIYSELLKIKKVAKIQKKVLEIGKEKDLFALKKRALHFIEKEDSIIPPTDLLLEGDELFIKDFWRSDSSVQLIARFLSKYFSILLELNRDMPGTTNSLSVKLINGTQSELSGDKAILIRIIANNPEYWNLLLYFRSKYYYQNGDYNKALACLNGIPHKDSQIDILTRKKEDLNSALIEQQDLDLIRLLKDKNNAAGLIDELTMYYSRCKHLINNPEALLNIFHRTITSFSDAKEHEKLCQLHEKEAFKDLLGQLTLNVLKSPRLLTNKKIVGMLHASLDMLSRSNASKGSENILPLIPFILNFPTNKFKTFPLKVKDIAINKIKHALLNNKNASFLNFKTTDPDEINELFHQSSSIGLLARKIETELSLNGQLAIYYICLILFKIDNSLPHSIELTIDFVEALKKPSNKIEGSELICQFFAISLINVFLNQLTERKLTGQIETYQFKTYQLEKAILEASQSPHRSSDSISFFKKVIKEIKVEHSLRTVLEFLRNGHNNKGGSFPLEIHLRKIKNKILTNKSTLGIFFDILEKSKLPKKYTASISQFLNMIFISLKEMNSRNNSNGETPLYFIDETRKLLLKYTNKNFYNKMEIIKKRQKPDFGLLWNELEQIQVKLEISRNNSLYKDLRKFAKDLLIEDIFSNITCRNINRARLIYSKHHDCWNFRPEENQEISNTLLNRTCRFLRSVFGYNLTRATRMECDSLYEHLDRTDGLLEQFLCFSEEIFSYDQQQIFLTFLHSNLKDVFEDDWEDSWEDNWEDEGDK